MSEDVKEVDGDDADADETMGSDLLDLPALRAVVAQQLTHRCEGGADDAAAASVITILPLSPFLLVVIRAFLCSGGCEGSDDGAFLRLALLMADEVGEDIGQWHRLVLQEREEGGHGSSGVLLQLSSCGGEVRHEVVVDDAGHLLGLRPVRGGGGGGDDGGEGQLSLQVARAPGPLRRGGRGRHGEVVGITSAAPAGAERVAPTHCRRGRHTRLALL